MSLTMSPTTSLLIQLCVEAQSGRMCQYYKVLHFTFRNQAAYGLKQHADHNTRVETFHYHAHDVLSPELHNPPNRLSQRPEDSFLKPQSDSRTHPDDTRLFLRVQKKPQWNEPLLPLTNSQNRFLPGVQVDVALYCSNSARCELCVVASLKRLPEPEGFWVLWVHRGYTLASLNFLCLKVLLSSRTPERPSATICGRNLQVRPVYGAVCDVEEHGLCH